MDKGLRAALGIALVAVGYFLAPSSTWSIVAYLLAIIALLTSLVGYCPLNQLFGIDTCSKAQAG
jgi:hypothetical protein